MTDDERREAERVWEDIDHKWRYDNDAGQTRQQLAIPIIAAARVRWRNEALGEAAKGPSDCKCNACQLWREHLRALKK